MDKDLIDELQALNDKGKSQDEILYFLFLKGLSITDAIIATRKLYGINLEEAKRLVVVNSCWANTHNQNQYLHDALEEISARSTDM
jgi:hypothetical protein